MAQTEPIYRARVFSDVHKEDASKRLSKKDMIKLWNDSKFIEHCREQVLWYSDFAPSYGFPNARRGKLAFPRWRQYLTSCYTWKNYSLRSQFSGEQSVINLKSQINFLLVTSNTTKIISIPTTLKPQKTTFRLFS